MKKLFVIDTNVVLFDHTCIYIFHEHDVALSSSCWRARPLQAR
jgi:predicted ribonuclease YlaK